MEKTGQKGLRVFSGFDGGSGGNIAAFTLGWDIEKYYASEIDKAAMAQTQASFPHTIQLGKIQRVRAYLQAGTKILGKIAQQHPYYQLAQHCTDILTNGIDLLIGGSPCQGFSLAGKQLNFKDKRSALFFEFVKIREIIAPKYFFLENVVMQKKYKAAISKLMGVEPIKINAALVSAQNRRRLYWTNFRLRQLDLFGTMTPDIAQPKDKKIQLRDILQPEEEIAPKYYLSEVQQKRLLKKGFRGLGINAKTKPLRAGWKIGTEKHNSDTTAVKNHDGLLAITEKAQCLDANYSKGPDNHGQRTYICVSQVGRRINPASGKREDNNKALQCIQRIEPAPAGKSNCLTTVEKDNLILIKEPAGAQAINLHGHYRLRRLTPRECMRLQGWPEWIRQHVSDTRMYEILGNGWQNGVITYLFSHIKESEQWKKQSKPTLGNGGIGRTGPVA